jgi:PIN domain nuclease of toxin-antitoxin system
MISTILCRRTSSSSLIGEMKLLLDTHIFLWYITNDDRLPPPMADAIRHLENEAFLSVVSVWEILVKNQIGKLALPSPADRYVRDQRQRHRISSLALEEEELSGLLELPPHHEIRLTACSFVRPSITTSSW